MKIYQEEQTQASWKCSISMESQAWRKSKHK